MKKAKGFFGAFAVTLCVLGLGAGLFAAGHNSHRMARGDDTDAAYRFDGGTLLLTDSAGNTVRLMPVAEEDTRAALLPAPLRACAHGLRFLAAAAERLSERLG